MNLKHLFAGIFVLVPFAFAAWVYPSLPPTIPIHFNMEGKADGWGSRDSVFIGPLILGFVSILVYFLMANIRKIDPKRYEGADDKVYAQFGLFLVAFLSVLSLVIILSAVNQGKWIFITFMLILAVMIIAPLIHSFTFFKRQKKA
jgi:uncharacterized membrane protein